MPVCPAQPWEQQLLRLVSEQGAVPLDQLARFLDVEEAQAARMGWHLVDRGLAVCRPVLHGEPPWLWPTFRGNRASGTGCRAPSRPLRGSSESGPSTRCASTLPLGRQRRVGSAVVRSDRSRVNAAPMFKLWLRSRESSTPSSFGLEG